MLLMHLSMLRYVLCGAVYVKTKDIMVVSNFFSFENYQIKE